MLVFGAAFTIPPSTGPVVERVGACIGQPDEGRKVTAADWAAHLPLAFATVVVVIGVNAVFIWQIMRKRNQGQAGV
jgi:hypothetical protein